MKFRFLIFPFLLHTNTDTWSNGSNIKMKPSRQLPKLWPGTCTINFIPIMTWTAIYKPKTTLGSIKTQRLDSSHCSHLGHFPYHTGKKYSPTNEHILEVFWATSDQYQVILEHLVFGKFTMMSGRPRQLEMAVR